MADRMLVTTLMRSSITGADRTGQHRDVSPQGVAGCQATSINTPIHPPCLLDKLSVACVGCNEPGPFPERYLDRGAHGSLLMAFPGTGNKGV
jgi:hypothetical protein